LHAVERLAHACVQRSSSLPSRRNRGAPFVGRIADRRRPQRGIGVRLIVATAGRNLGET
jgi:hypothetical protein